MRRCIICCLDMAASECSWAAPLCDSRAQAAPLRLQEPAGFEPEPGPVCSAETNAQTATTAGSPEPTTVAPAPPATTTAAPATTTAAPTTTTAAPTTTTAAPTTTRGAKLFAVCSEGIVRHALNGQPHLTGWSCTLLAW